MDITDHYFLEIISNVKRHVPEFETGWDNDSQYMVMFEFGMFLVNIYPNKDVFQRCVQFIEEALEKGSSITQEVIALEVFTQLYDHDSIINDVKQFLSKESNIILDYYHLQHNKSYPAK